MTAGQPEAAWYGVVYVGPEHGVQWRSDRVAAIAPVRIELDRGCVVSIDPAFPGEVLSWELSASADAGVLAAAVGDPGLAGVVAGARASGAQRRVVPGPRLTAEWTRFAEVEAVVRWTMRPVHQGALLIDRAVAAAGVHRDAEAATLFIYAEDALTDLVQRCIDSELPSAVIDLVRAAALVGQLREMRGGWAEMADELAGVAALDDSVLLEWLARLRRPASALGGLAGTLGDGGSETVDSGFLDPLMVPPRIIGWSGASRPELRIERDSDGDVFRLTAVLAAGVDPYCREVGRLLAYAADRADGTLLAAAPMQLDGAAMVAVLPGNGHPLSELVFGMVDAGTDVAALRTDPVGRCLTEVDRMMIDAWAQQRAAMAAVHAVSPVAAENALHAAQAERRSRLRTARTAVRAARKRLERELAAQGASGKAAEEDTRVLGTVLRARLAALARYDGAIETDGGTPLLTDLVAPEVDW